MSCDRDLRDRLVGDGLREALRPHENILVGKLEGTSDGAWLPVGAEEGEALNKVGPALGTSDGSVGAELGTSDGSVGLDEGA